MHRGARTLGMHPHLEAIPHALMVAYLRKARSVRGYPECSEGRVLSECMLTLRLSRMIRGSRTLGVRPHFEAIPHAPRVVYPQNAFSL